MRYDPPFHRSNGLLPAVLVVVALALFPLVFDASYLRHLMVLAFIFAIVAASWDLSFGYGGLFNFAHVALFAVGIYTYGILAKTLGVDPWLSILAAGPVAMVFAAIMVLPVLRLDGIYVILVTIAFSQLIFQIVISQSGITGGTSGMVTLPSLAIGDYRLVKDGKIGYYYTALTLLVVSCIGLHLVVRSRIGRAIVALRDNKYYAIVRGVPEGRTRLVTLCTSALFTGLAGGFYGSYVRVASPDIFGLGSLTLILSMLLVGGSATLWGPVMGAFVLTLLSEWLAGLGPWREIMIALLIIFVMVFYPGGLWGVTQAVRESIAARLSALRAWQRRGTGRTRREARLGTRERVIETRHARVAVADSGEPSLVVPQPESLPALPAAEDKTGRTVAAGPPILLIHGNSACKEAFHHQFAAFADRHRVIAFDLPGHGASDNADPERGYQVPAYADVAEDVLQALGVTRAVLVGWSLGGYVALELAARRPDAYAGLVICGTSPLNVVPDDFARGYDASSHVVLAGKQFFTGAERRRFADAATAPLNADTGFLHRNIDRTDGRTRYYMIGNLPVVDWPRQMRMLREGRIPFAILNGSDDPFLNHEYIAGLEYGSLWRDRPMDIEAGAHAPFLNRATVFNERLAAFIAEAVERSNGSCGRSALRP